MKTIQQLLLGSILLSFISCSAKSDTVSKNGKLKIQVVLLNNTTKATMPRDVGPATSAITNLDLKSYSAKTGEVIFSNVEAAMQKIGNQRTKTNFYLDDQYLFSLIYTSDILSNLYNEPVLHHALTDLGNTKSEHWYIHNGYPWGVVVNDVSKYTGQTENWISERIDNFKKIETNWNLFVEELKKGGKYIN